MVVGIVGMGLIGGSFGRLLLKNTKYTVYGADRSEESLSKALLVNAMHAPLNEENAREVDLLIVSVYPRGFFAAAKPWLPLLKEGAAVLDFCGVKRKVTEEMRALAEQFPQLSFIGGHPMAGREFWGIEHAVPSLFERASMILVPVSVSLEKISHLKGLFLSLGLSRVVVTTAEKHDAMIALTSQLAHVLSGAYVQSPAARGYVGYSAGSFRDMTRVAKLNPAMWTELMTENADFLTGELNGLIERLSLYRDALSARDEEALRQLLADGAKEKERLDKLSREKS